jgi:lipoate-protein ligase A
MRPPQALTDPAALALLHRMTAVPWQVIRPEAATGSANMAQDEALLQAAIAEQLPPTLRFYTWSPPAVSLGHFQTTDAIDVEYARRRGWDVVRRPTGGRAVLHQHELTYSVVLPPSVVDGAGVRTSYSVLVGALNAGLAPLLQDIVLAQPVQAPACDARTNRAANCFALASECDTVIPEGKLVGSAQVRRSGALLQHGSILLDAEPEAWTALFGTSGRLVTLRQLLGRSVSPPEVSALILRGFAAFGVSFLETIHEPPAGVR